MRASFASLIHISTLSFCSSFCCQQAIAVHWSPVRLVCNCRVGFAHRDLRNGRLSQRMNCDHCSPHSKPSPFVSCSALHHHHRPPLSHSHAPRSLACHFPAHLSDRNTAVSSSSSRPTASHSNGPAPHSPRLSALFVSVFCHISSLIDPSCPCRFSRVRDRSISSTFNQHRESVSRQNKQRDET